MSTTNNEFVNSVIDFAKNYYVTSSKFLRKYGHNMILGMAALTFIFQFFPLFSPTFQSNVNDDYAYNDQLSYLFILGNMALLMVCILPGIDLVLDVLAPFTSSSYSAYFRPQVAEKAKEEASELAAKTTRLSKVERAMFLIGVMSSAVSIFPAYNNTNPKEGYFLYNAFENNNSVFTLLPILSFLCRSTTTWTPLLTLTIAACVCISDLTSTMAYIYIYQSQLFINLTTVSPAMMLLASSLYVTTMFASAYNTYVWHKSKGSKIVGSEDSLGAMDLLNEEHIHIATVAAQSFVTLIDFGINAYWYYVLTLGPLTLDQTGTIFIAMAASNCLTFLIEFRVRKSEVSTTLVSAYFY